MICPHCKKSFSAESKFVVPFGRSKGTPIEILATKELEGLVKFLESKADPSSKWHEKNQAQLQACKDELAGRNQDVMF